MKKNKMGRRIQAILLLVILLFNTLQGAVVTAKSRTNDTNQVVYQGDNYEVTYQVENQWTDGFKVQVQVKNVGQEVIDNWAVGFKLSHQISNIWNGKVTSNEDGYVVVKNTGSNQDIMPGESVSFGFNATWKDEIVLPQEFDLLCKEVEVGKEDVEVIYNVTNDWGSGFNAELRIKNLSDETLEDWTLAFDYANQMGDPWTGKIISQKDGHYILKNSGYNANIAPGQEVVIGFTCTDGDASENIHNAVVKVIKNEKKAQVVEPEVTPTPSPEKPDRTPEPEVEIGAAYFKEPAQEDIVFSEETGLYYVKNQLLISGLVGTPKEAVEAIMSDVGGTIVGYIALTSDYQIEFSEEKDIDELTRIADYVNSFSFIENVTLHLVSYMDVDMTTTNDTRYLDDDWNETSPDGNNWGLEALKVPTAWDQSGSFQSVRVGLLDTMFDVNHEDLFFDHTYENDYTEYSSEHGTHVAGIMAGLVNNNAGIAGVINDARLYGYSMYHTPEEMSSVMQYKVGFATLIGNNVKAINVSLNTGREACFSASRGKETAINYVNENAAILGGFLNKLVSQGYEFVIVAAAGNVEDTFFVQDANSTYGYRYSRETDDPNDLLRGNASAYYNSFLNAITIPSVKARIITVGSIGHNVSGTGENQVTTYSYSSFSNTGDRVDVCAPGEDILSTVPGEGTYEELSGTSMASPYITGISGMLFQENPSLTGAQVKNIICNNTSTTVTDSHGRSYGMPDASVCVEKAKNAASVPPESMLPSGIVTGKIVNNYGIPIKGVKITAYRTSVGESNLENYFTTGETDENGNYEMVLTQGTYNLNLYAEGYLPCVIENITVNPNETTYMENVIIVKWIGNMLFANIQGKVIHALNGEAVSGATVQLRKGWNNTTGSYVTDLFGSTKKATTSLTGEFELSAGVGIYTAEITKNGFVTGYYNVVSTTGDNSNEQTMVLTPVLQDDEYRIVLTWGETPSDLDSHLSYYKDDVRKFHVYYSDKLGYLDGEKIAQLDYDDTTSYGPETVTVTLSVDQLQGGKFIYSVHDFTNRSSSSSKEMSLSGAVVRVYRGNNLIQNYNIPQNVSGTVWRVFEITQDGITTLNEFDNISNPSSVY